MSALTGFWRLGDSAQIIVFSLVTNKVLSLAAGIARGHFVSLATDRILSFYHSSGSQSRVWHWICKQDWHQSPDHCHQRIHPRYHPSLHLCRYPIIFLCHQRLYLLLGKPFVLWPTTQSCHLSHTPPGGSWWGFSSPLVSGKFNRRSLFGYQRCIGCHRWLVRGIWCWFRDRWQPGNSLSGWYCCHWQFTILARRIYHRQVGFAFQPDQRIQGRLSMLLRNSWKDPAIKE